MALFDQQRTEGNGSKVDTQLTADTPEVAEAINDFKNGGAIAAYEMEQNSTDYNDYSQGLPKTEFLSTHGNFSLAHLFSLTSEEEVRKIAESVASIRITNFINEKKLFAIEDLFALAHGGGSGTLGQHGRGGRISLTAITALRLAERVEISSRDGRGNWRANCTYGPAFTAEFQRDFLRYELTRRPLEDPTNQTITEIIHPSADLLLAFWRLRNVFLLVNPAYQHQVLLSKQEQVACVPSLFTLKADRPNTHEDFETSFAENFEPATLPKLNLSQEMLAKYQHTPRVEILPNDFSSSEKKQKEFFYVYVDGLRVQVGTDYLKNNAVLNWSFWGLREGHNYSGYKASRSKDSKSLEGEPTEAMALTLGRCTNPEVFKLLLEGFVQLEQSSARPWELQFKKETLQTALHESGKARAALQIGWDQFLSARGITPPAVATTDLQVAAELKKRDIPHVYFLVACKNYVELLTSLGIARKPDEEVEGAAEAQAATEFQIETKSLTPELFVDTFLDWALSSYARVTFLPSGKELELVFPAQETKNPETTVMSFKGLPGPIIKVIEALLEQVSGQFEIRLLTPTRNGEGQEITIQFKESDKRMFARSTYTFQNRPHTIDSQHWKIAIHTVSNTESGEWNKTLTLLRSKGVLSPEGTVNIERYLEAFPGTEKSALQVALFRARQSELKVARQLEATLSLSGESRKASQGSPLFPIEKVRALNTMEIPLREFIGLFPIHESILPSHAQPIEAITSAYSEEERNKLLEAFLAAFNHPDMQLASTESLPLTSRVILLAHLNPFYSASLAEGETITRRIVSMRTEVPTTPHMQINRKIPVGHFVLPHPYGTRITEIRHPQGEAALKDITLRSSSSKTDQPILVLETHKVLPPGLILMVETDTRNASTYDEAKELANITQESQLDSQVKDFVEKLRTVVQRGQVKMAVDAAMTWWSQRFSLGSPERKINASAQMDGGYFAHLINYPTGDASQASAGFIAIMRLLKIPSRERLAYRGTGGRFFPGPSTYPLVEVYFERQWHLIDPRTGYIDVNGKGKEPIDYDLKLNISRSSMRWGGKERSIESPYERLGLWTLIKNLEKQAQDTKTVGLVTRGLLEKLQSILQEDDRIDRPYFEALVEKNELRTPKGRESLGILTGAERAIGLLNTVFEETALELPYSTTILESDFVERAKLLRFLDRDWAMLADALVRSGGKAMAIAIILVLCTAVASFGISAVFPPGENGLSVPVPDWLSDIFPDIGEMQEVPGSGSEGSGGGESRQLPNPDRGGGEGGPAQPLPENAPDWFAQCVTELDDSDTAVEQIWDCLLDAMEQPAAPVTPQDRSNRT